MPRPNTPAGQSPPAEIIDSTHHGAWIAIVTAIGVTLLLFSLLIRIYVRFAVSPTIRLADYVLGVAGVNLVISVVEDEREVDAAQVFAIVQSCLVFWEVSIGLGSSIELISPRHIQKLQTSAFASDVLYLVTLYLSKCCIHFIYRHLTPSIQHHRLFWAVVGLSTVWALCSILMIGINCELNRPWGDITSRCTNMFLRWQLIAAFDIITEICLFLQSVAIVFRLQMALKRKAIVVGAFALRLPIVAVAALRLHYLNIQIHSLNPPLHGVIAIILTEVQLQYSIISCLTCSIKPFVSAVTTNYGSVAINVEVYESINGPGTKAYGAGTKAYGVGSKQRSQRSNGESYVLSSASKRGKLTSATRQESEDKPKLHFRPDTFHTSTTSVGTRVRRDTDSNDSTKMIIRKDIEYSVDVEDRSWADGGTQYSL